MARVLGIKQLQVKVNRLKKKYASDAKEGVVTGYTQRYAIYAHENTKATGGSIAKGKQAKFLETPARRYGNVLGKIVATTVRKTGSLMQGLLLAGLRLQRESQKIVLIDTSALRASAYTCKESLHPQVAATAFAKSEAVRIAEESKRAKSRK